MTRPKKRKAKRLPAEEKSDQDRLTARDIAHAIAASEVGLARRLTVKDGMDIMGIVADFVGEAMAKRRQVYIYQLGVFRTSHQAPKTMKMPWKDEPLEVPESHRATFNPAKRLIQAAATGELPSRSHAVKGRAERAGRASPWDVIPEVDEEGVVEGDNISELV